MGKKAIDAPRGDTEFKVSDPFSIVIIGLDTDDGPEHELFDETAKDPPPDYLGPSMQRNGQQAPVRVRKNGDVVECVAGRSRIKAARVLVHGSYTTPNPNFKGSVPFELRVMRPTKFEPGGAFSAMVAENVDRKDVSPLQKAQLALRAMKHFGYDEAGVAEMFHVEPQAVGQWLSYFNCAPEVQKAVREGAPFSICPALSKLKRTEQVQQLAEMTASGEKVSTRSVAARVRAVQNGESTAEGAVVVSNRVIRKIALDYARLYREGGELPIELKGKTPEEAFVLGLRAAVHDVQPSIIKGFVGWIRDLEKKPKKSKKKSADARH